METTATYKIEYNKDAIMRWDADGKTYTETISDATEEDLMETLDTLYVDAVYDDDGEYKSLGDFLSTYEYDADFTGSAVLLRLYKNNKLVYKNSCIDHYEIEDEDDDDFDDDDFDFDEEAMAVDHLIGILDLNLYGTGVRIVECDGDTSEDSRGRRCVKLYLTVSAPGETYAIATIKKILGDSSINDTGFDKDVKVYRSTSEAGKRRINIDVEAYNSL